MSDYYKRTVEKIRADAQKRLDENERNYQDTGSSRTYKAIERNDNLVRTCDLALEAIKGDCHFCKRKNRLIDDMINRYKKLEILSILKRYCTILLISDIERGD